jgi:fructokinase
MSCVVCLGEALIDFVADVSGVTLEECPGFRKAAGGAPANVAAGLGRLGAAARFVGKVGKDAFGRFLRDTLAAEGVDTRPLRFETAARTGLAFVSLTAEGERDFMFYRNPSADMLLRPDEIAADLFTDARVFHFGSITLIAEPTRSATLRAVELARAAGCILSFDPNLRPPLWDSLAHARAEILATIPRVDIVKVNEEELEFLFPGADPVRGGAELRALGPALALVTLGAAGCCYSTADAAATVPGFSVPVVDTTGAGDGFVVGFLAELPSDIPPGRLPPAEMQRILRFANAVGALTCTRRGAIPSLPTRAEVEALLGRGK